MIDLDIELTFEKAKELSALKPISPGTYEFSVARIEVGNTAVGRPQWTCFLKVEGSPEYNNRELRYNVPLPWIDPITGKVDVSGIGLLVNLVQGVGATWFGDLKNHDVQDALRLSLIGARGFMRVGIRKRVREDTGEEVEENTVRVVKGRR